MYNGDGLTVPNSPLAVEQELLEGTGRVMADGAAIYVEHLNVSENQFVVVRSPSKDVALETLRFPSSRYDEAWRQFSGWVK